MKFVCALSALLTTATFLSFSPAVVVTAQDAPATVVDIAVGSEDHTILVQAVAEAGMVDALQTGGPITVFAPVDSAFAGLDLDRLLSPAYKAHLVDLLKYHVYGGQILSSNLEVGLEARMLNGERINVTSLNPPMVNDATIIVPDLTAGNGVVHVTDTVLLPTSATSNIVDIAAGNPSFSTLVELVQAAGLAGVLSNPTSSLTVFAPTNAAFASLPEGTIDSLKEAENRDTLRSILTYHVLKGVVKSDMLTDGMVVMMENGKSAPVSLESGSMIYNANIITPDILASNGVIHVIDTVLVPPAVTVVDTASESPAHTVLVEALTVAGLVDDLSGPGNVTVFAPTNEAFMMVDTERLLDPQYLPHLIDLLYFHVSPSPVLSSDLALGASVTQLNGEDITVTSLDPPTVNNATVLQADLVTDNGIIHVLDMVLLPTSATHTLVDVAVENPNFSTLVELLVTAGLAETLATTGPYTVFAPTNEAFAKIPQQTLAALTNDQLVDILTYHVTEGIVTSDMVENNMALTMLNGSPAIVTVTNGTPKVGPANIVDTDILGNNGVIHVIDTVLMPPSLASEGQASNNGVSVVVVLNGQETVVLAAEEEVPVESVESMDDKDEDYEDEAMEKNKGY